MLTNFNSIYEELSNLFTESSTEAIPEVIAFLLPNTKNGYLSNWYPSPINLYGQNFSSGEQAFMYAKADTFMDEEIKTQILQTNDPKKLKALGRKIKNFDEAVWAAARVDLMTEIVTAKFEQNQDLMQLLLSTGDALLAEANNFDKFWGCGLRTSDATINNPERWPGKNTLGTILMSIRDSHYNKINEDISLTEAKQVGPVSYGVKGSGDASAVEMLTTILQSDKIKSSEAQAGLYPNSEEDAFVSTSRDLLSHIKDNRQRPVGLILDGDKLSNTYKINPINWATLELDKEVSRLNLKALYEYTNQDDPKEKAYKVQFDSYGSFLITKRIFDLLERIMQCYNATETINRKGERVNLGATHGFVANDRVGKTGRPKPGKWIISKGYFYSVPNGGGVNISKGTLNKYRDQLSDSELDISDNAFISELIHNKVLDETEERLIQKVVYTFAPEAYKKDGTLRKGAKKRQADVYFNIKDCIKLILLPVAYKNCWDTNGENTTYYHYNNKGYRSVRELSDGARLAVDIPRLKSVITEKGLEDKVFWIDQNTTNAAVHNAIK
jgi:ribA/ribD-fused uncharacterized protein